MHHTHISPIYHWWYIISAIDSIVKWKTSLFLLFLRYYYCVVIDWKLLTLSWALFGNGFASLTLLSCCKKWREWFDKKCLWQELKYTDVSVKRPDMQIFQTSRNHLKFLDARWVTWSKFHMEDTQMLGTTIQNLVSRTTWHLEFRYPCHKHF